MISILHGCWKVHTIYNKNHLQYASLQSHVHLEHNYQVPSQLAAPGSSTYKVGCQWPKVHLSTLCLTQRQPDIFRIYHCHGVLTNYEPTAMDHLGWLEFPTGSGTRTHPGCPTATGQATGCQGPGRGDDDGVAISCEVKNSGRAFWEVWDGCQITFGNQKS